jgi:hypothetical protein
MEAIDRLAPSSIQYRNFSSTDVQLMISKWQMLFEQQKHFNFDNSQSLSDDEYKIFTSLTKVQFDDLVWYISKSNIHNSSNRSIRTALAIFLCKLQLGLSNILLTVLFQLPNKRTVSGLLESIRTALMIEFVSRVMKLFVNILQQLLSSLCVPMNLIQQSLLSTGHISTYK